MSASQFFFRDAADAWIRGHGGLALRRVKLQSVSPHFSGRARQATPLLKRYFLPSSLLIRPSSLLPTFDFFEQCVMSHFSGDDEGCRTQNGWIFG